jgi:hypothetical protein
MLLWGGEGWQELPRVGADDLHAVRILDEHDLFIGGLQHLYRYDGARLVSLADTTASVSGLWARGPGDVWAVMGETVWHLSGPHYATRYTPTGGTGPLFAVAGGAPDEPVIVAGAGGVWRWDHPVWQHLDGEAGPVYGCVSSLDGSTVYVVTQGGARREWTAARGAWHTLFQAPGPLCGCYLDEAQGLMRMVGEGIYWHQIGEARPVAVRPAELVGHAHA